MDDDDFGSDADFLALATAAEQQRAKGTRPSAPAPSVQRQPPGEPSPVKKVTQPTPQALPARAGPSAILVSPRQKGNPLLAHFQNLPWEWTDTPADYVVGATTCALFLSLKYHRLHPEYIYARIRALGARYNLRVLLALVDIDNHEQPLRELAKTGLINNLTLVLAWSAREAARYLEAYKALERTGPAAIRGAPAASYADRLVEFATVPRGVNRSDAVALVSQFGSLRAAVNARPAEVAALQGWGQVKVQRWCEAVHEPFRVAHAGARRADARAGPADVVPLGRAPNVPRTESRPSLEPAGAQQGAHAPDPVPGRRENVAAEDDDDADAEMALAAYPETETADLGERGPPAAPAEQSPALAGQQRSQPPKLSEGIQAALARYRNQH